MDNVSVLQYVMQLGPTGVALVVAWYLHRDHNRIMAEKDAEFIKAIHSNAADMKGIADKIEKVADRQNATMVDIDKAHTANNRETFQLLIGIVGEQKATLHQVASQVTSRLDHVDATVRHLESTVDTLVETVQEHGQKFDDLKRSLPPPRPIESPGIAPGGDFRPARA